MRKIAVVGATGRLGRRVVERLIARGEDVIAVCRDLTKAGGLPISVRCKMGDFSYPETIEDALAEAEIVVSCVNAVHIPTILAHLPDNIARTIVMGSSRRYSLYPDATAVAVHNAELALGDTRRPYVILLSTMIYGAGGSVIDSWANLVRRFPVLPVPSGKNALIQPIHIDDVADSITAAIDTDVATGKPIIIAGSETLTQYELVRRIAEIVERSRLLIPVPVSFLGKLAWLTSRMPGFAGYGARIGRLVEDRSFDLENMRLLLGVNPRPLDLTFLRNQSD